jgi:hypothetical protein
MQMFSDETFIPSAGTPDQIEELLSIYRRFVMIEDPEASWTNTRALIGMGEVLSELGAELNACFVQDVLSASPASLAEEQRD